ncbi:MAG: hypothetical protein O3C36_02925 [archaeon]|nr:hypothetical protein [archaeon]
MRHRAISTLPVVLLSSTLLLVIFHPVVLAQSAWEEDGWLRTSYAQDRLEAGDEFGCYGVPGLSWQNDPGAVASACRDYLEDRLNASSWGVRPLSTYTPDGLSMADHQKVASQGFVIHGDETGLRDTAWHSAEDEPRDLWEWYNLGRRGGSLEKGLASLAAVEKAIDDGGLFNMYWIGRVNDATVRHDREVLALLDEHPDVWLTTWGEAWSVWSGKRCYEFSHETQPATNGTILSFEPLITPACTGVNDGLPWNVPLTWLIDTGGAQVVSVSDGTEELSSIEGEKRLLEGWRVQEDGTLVIALVNGHPVEILLSDENASYDVLGQTRFFNNLSSAVTVAGHETTDLFAWSKRFLEDTQVKFTWLVQPRAVEDGHAWIPYAVLGVTFATVVAMLGVLGREGLGPFSSMAAFTKAPKSHFGQEMKQSLDVEEED